MHVKYITAHITGLSSKEPHEIGDLFIEHSKGTLLSKQWFDRIIRDIIPAKSLSSHEKEVLVYDTNSHAYSSTVCLHAVVRSKNIVCTCVSEDYNHQCMSQILQ